MPVSSTDTTNAKVQAIEAGFGETTNGIRDIEMSRTNTMRKTAPQKHFRFHRVSRLGRRLPSMITAVPQTSRSNPSKTGLENQAMTMNNKGQAPKDSRKHKHSRENHPAYLEMELNVWYFWKLSFLQISEL
jgi:hypothetical protein